MKRIDYNLITGHGKHVKINLYLETIFVFDSVCLRSAKLSQILMSVLFSKVMYFGVLPLQENVRTIPVPFSLTLKNTELSEILILLELKNRIFFFYNWHKYI